jgi:hypothetical protein
MPATPRSSSSSRFRIALRALICASLGAAPWAGAPLAGAGPSPAGARPDAELARLAFDRLRGLAGRWEARSTQGWEGSSEIREIARGSALLATSEVDPHSGETMATLYSLDGERLVLVHYCVAGNQPRLVATAVSADASHIEFTFDGGGDLPSRDRGHMDRVVVELLDGDRYRSQWTWFQDGEERWLEAIEHRRLREQGGESGR